MLLQAIEYDANLLEIIVTSFLFYWPHMIVFTVALMAFNVAVPFSLSALSAFPFAEVSKSDRWHSVMMSAFPVLVSVLTALSFIAYIGAAAYFVLHKGH